jgi:hypothetical protein
MERLKEVSLRSRGEREERKTGRSENTQKEWEHVDVHMRLEKAAMVEVLPMDVPANIPDPFQANAHPSSLQGTSMISKYKYSHYYYMYYSPWTPLTSGRDGNGVPAQD